MRNIKIVLLIIGLILSACNKTETKSNLSTDKNLSSLESDKKQIQILIREVLNWSNSKKCIDLIPVISDSKDSIYIGFDLVKHKKNLEQLKQTNLFAEEFVENYNQIILTLDNGLKNGHYDSWQINELPSFGFVNDVNPWCLCQDVPYDKPNPYDFVEINIVDSKKGEVEWKWGIQYLNGDSDNYWKNFTYKFRVIRENDKWKISYLSGFDFNESTKKH